MNLNDIQNGLDEELNMKNLYTPKDIKVFPRIKKNLKKNEANKSTIELTKGLEDISIKGNDKIKLHKNNTKNFDSIVIGEKLEDINIKENTPKNTKFKNLINISKFQYKEKINFKKKSKKGFVFKIIFFLFFVILIDSFLVYKTINEGYNKILLIKEGGNIEKIKKNVNDAKFNFLVGGFLFKPFSLLDFQNIKNIDLAIQGGEEMTKLGDDGIKTYFKIKDLIAKKGADNIMLSNLFFNLKEDLIEINNGLNKSYNLFDQVRNIGNKNIEQKIIDDKKILKNIIYYTNIINNNFDTILSLLGHEKEKKYLVVFQNSDEIRPTGGFMGSMGFLTFDRGKVLKFEKSDVYANEWEIKKSDIKKEPAPKGIDQLTKNFGLRDSNYFPEIAKSSDKIKYFIEKTGVKIDGVIYLNQNMILDFLEKNGKVDSISIGEVISDKNFSEIMSILVEAKIYKVGTLGTPKQILFDFIEEFTKQLKSKGDYISYINIILKNIEKRNIIFYSFNEKENKLLKDLGINGNLDYKKSLDFSYPVFTSISGNKSDRYMQRSFEKTLKINKDCSIETSLKINSTHNLTDKKLNELNLLIENYNIEDKEKALQIQGKGDNKQYIRVILPEKAIIKPNENITISNLENTKVIDFFINTKRLETTNFNIDYKLENPECKPYNYIFYKQPGIKDYDFKLIKGDEKIIQKGLNLDFKFNNPK